MVGCGKPGLGLARPDKVGNGVACERRGQHRRRCCSVRLHPWSGTARKGATRRGSVRCGLAWRGLVWPANAGACILRDACRCVCTYGEVCQGEARRAGAWYVED